MINMLLMEVLQKRVVKLYRRELALLTGIRVMRPHLVHLLQSLPHLTTNQRVRLSRAKQMLMNLLCLSTVGNKEH